MRTCLGALLALVVVVAAGCSKGAPLGPPPAPPVPTPQAFATHPPAIGAALRPSPVSDQPPAALSPKSDQPAALSPKSDQPAALAPVAVSPSAVSSAVVASAPYRGGPLVYVAIGASETVGVGANDPSREGWVPDLAQLLGPETRLRNLGVSGTLLSTALSDQLPLAIHEQPDLVTVWLAVNDLNAHVPLERYSADLDTLLAGLARQTSARILVGSVPDLTLVPAYKATDPVALRAQVGQWNAAIAQVAGRHGAVVVDLYAGYAELGRHPEYLSGDGFHPSTAGYARVGEMFYEAARLVLPG